MAEFAIYPFAALGGSLALSPMPGRSGDLARDVAHMLAWGPTRVLTMCEDDEFGPGDVAQIGASLADAGVSWCHFPIADYGAPEPASEADWTVLSAQLRDDLRAGARVLVHCRGGCGRSGMAALRLMVDGGMGAGAALAALRQARPCAVETAAQMRWATAGAITTLG